VQPFGVLHLTYDWMWSFQVDGDIDVFVEARVRNLKTERRVAMFIRTT
jgi:hypothetical protein